MYRLVILIVLLVLSAMLTLPAPTQQNLIPNGDFEIDSNADGVPDGWDADPVSFSRHTSSDMAAFLAKFPSHEQVLASNGVDSVDGWKIVEWETDSQMHPFYKTKKWYNTLRDELVPQNSRFGASPLPQGLDIGNVTCVLSHRKPQKQVASDAVSVKPNTGYRLNYWFKMSGWNPMGVQVVVSDDTPGSPTRGDFITTNRMLWPWCPEWRQCEIVFRTSASQSHLKVLLWMFHEEENDNRRLWYDNVTLYEDNSVLVGDIGISTSEESKWPKEVLENGYVAVARPAFPAPLHGYMPGEEEIGQPLKLALAPGENGSGAVFVRALDDIKLKATCSSLVSSAGFGISNGSTYTTRSIFIRTVEDSKTVMDTQRYLIKPEFLLNSNSLEVRKNDGGSFYLTVEVPLGTPAGKYTGEVQVSSVDGTRLTRIPVSLQVYDLQLNEADIAFGTWYEITPYYGLKRLGSPITLPGADLIYLLDQQRHGMNTVANYGVVERRGKDGSLNVAFAELDKMMSNVKQAGLCKNQPMLLYAIGEGGIESRGWGDFGGKDKTVKQLANHARRSGWPPFIIGVLDEPSNSKAAKIVEDVMSYYTPLRRQGIAKTVSAGIIPDTQGKYYDVWIEHVTELSKDAKDIQRQAKDKRSQAWAYDCIFSAQNPVLDRFYAGLWTWATKVKGNMVWSYGWYVRINQNGLPESKLAWEARLAGVNDYRYLRTLEQAVEKARKRSNKTKTVVEAQDFLQKLRNRVAIDLYKWENIPLGNWIVDWNSPAGVSAEEYDSIRETCARYIQELNS